ncbi:AraC family transcriptional regulator [Chromohalobacter canadensis]|uniref:AraC family transcriptional regulator n=1 Tax=Chromohalobacter canadensis TaxID=141389 RepID=A0ABZ0YEN3_9GAMM|nr:AraC family transcriptional regulator [Chromohalobacter canadensis]MCK0770053.1 AraC family transcriptional regulator [Chromohalobacter canadensis]WQH10557.1 AraC family transcriptional regulator [Chromohalobacter canadensis]
MTQFWRDPTLPFVESRWASDSRACYRPHSHPTLSIGVVDRGQSQFQCQRRRERLTPGCLVSVPAGVVHDCNPLPDQPWSYQMLYLEPTWVSEVLDEASAETDAAPAMPSTVFIARDVAPYQAFCRLNALLFSSAPRADKEAGLIEFLGSRLWCHGDALAVHWPNSSALNDLQRHLLECLERPPSLEVLARDHGLSRYQVIRLFRRETGLTPHAWLLDQRIQQARRRLCQGVELSELAQELGFADQGHFQRAFKARVAVTPGRYRST